jgi:hypothetical protein
MKLVDMTDSKSVAFAGVAVRVRPLVPSNSRERGLVKTNPFFFAEYTVILN